MDDMSSMETANEISSSQSEKNYDDDDLSFYEEYMDWKRQNKHVSPTNRETALIFVPMKTKCGQRKRVLIDSIIY